MQETERMSQSCCGRHVRWWSAFSRESRRNQETHFRKSRQWTECALNSCCENTSKSCLYGMKTRDPIPMGIGAGFTQCWVWYIPILGQWMLSHLADRGNSWNISTRIIIIEMHIQWGGIRKCPRYLNHDLQWRAISLVPAWSHFELIVVVSACHKSFKIPDKEGIMHDTTISHSPIQNGVVERLNRTLVVQVCSIPHYKSLETPFGPKLWLLQNRSGT